MIEIEESSRFYSENGAQYLTASILHSTEQKHHGIAPVSFILTGKLLVTVRYTEPKAFTLFISRVIKPGNGIITSKCSGDHHPARPDRSSDRSHSGYSRGRGR